MKREVVELVASALEPVLPVLPLRGTDSEAREGGDLDFLVPKGSAVEACRRICVAAGERGWYVLGFRDIGYLASVVLTRTCGSDSVESVKLDFFSGLDWYGAGGPEVTDRFFEVLRPVARVEERRRALAGVVNFLQKAMTTGRLSDRDLARVRSAGASAELVTEVFDALALPIAPEEAETGALSPGAKWRLRAASAGGRAGLRRAWWLALVVAAHVRFKVGLGNQAGILVALGGLDGSGKSTVLGRLTRAYAAAGTTPPRHVHLLPDWIPLPHQLFRRNKTLQNYTRPYSEPAVTSRTSAALRLAYYLAAFLVAKVALGLAVWRGAVVIMDRSFLDFAADLARARIPHRTLPAPLLKACAPMGCLTFIDTVPETVVRRKGELTGEKAKELRARYHAVVHVLRATVVNGEGTPEAVYRETLACLDACYRSRLARTRST